MCHYRDCRADTTRTRLHIWSCLGQFVESCCHKICKITKEWLLQLKPAVGDMKEDILLPWCTVLNSSHMLHFIWSYLFIFLHLLLDLSISLYKYNVTQISLYTTNCFKLCYDDQTTGDALLWLAFKCLTRHSNKLSIFWNSVSSVYPYFMELIYVKSLVCLYIYISWRIVFCITFFLSEMATINQLNSSTFKTTQDMLAT